MLDTKQKEECHNSCSNDANFSVTDYDDTIRQCRSLKMLLRKLSITKLGEGLYSLHIDLFFDSIIIIIKQ